MRNSKIIFYLIFLSFLILGCKKKDKTPKEYFSFDANGVHYEYSQDVLQGFGTSRSAIYALSSSSFGYLIVGSSFKNPSAEGNITFNFAEDELSKKDTILLNGIVAIATISDFQNNGNNFRTNYLYNGMIVFSKKNSEILIGSFEFKAQQQYDSSLIHITNGKFAITLKNNP